MNFTCPKCGRTDDYPGVRPGNIGAICVCTCEMRWRPLEKSSREVKRYWQPIVCKVCNSHIGWAPYFRDEYQCRDCNTLPLNWDEDPEWMEKYESGDWEISGEPK